MDFTLTFSRSIERARRDSRGPEVGGITGLPTISSRHLHGREVSQHFTRKVLLSSEMLFRSVFAQKLPNNCPSLGNVIRRVEDVVGC